MKKIFGVLILFAALIVGGCSSEKDSQTEKNWEPQITQTFSIKGASEGLLVESKDFTSVKEERCLVPISEGEVLSFKAEVDNGNIKMKIEDKVYNIDKTQEFSVTVPTGNCQITFTRIDKFTGKLLLKAVPKV